jgi:hypothetical protein
MTDSTPSASTDDEPTDLSVGTFDPSTDSTDAPAESDDVEAVDAVADALPGGGRLDAPDDDVSGPVQVA